MAITEPRNSCSDAAVSGKHRPICGICLDQNGVRNSQTLERVIGHPMHSTRYPRIVCATCWERGRETPVTCRTFRAE